MNKNLCGKTPTGEEIYTYEIKNANGTTAKLTNIGACLTELWVKDKTGEFADVVLGHKDVPTYLENPCCFGASVAPFANRIGGASFTLNGKTYTLDKNNGENNLHSGNNPLHHKVWETLIEEDDSIRFAIDKADMECGFPGNVHFEVIYTLAEDDSLILDYIITSDSDTIVNPTNHSYFNLAGHGSGNILNQVLWLNADGFTPAGADSIPHGDIRKVQGTPFDFTTPKPIGQDINEDYDELNYERGYDHNFVLSRDVRAPQYDIDEMTMYEIGSLSDPKSGRRMTVYTELPGVQVYTGNGIADKEPLIGKENVSYGRYQGVALETQFFPNAVNVDSFELPVLGENNTYRSRTVYRFSCG